MHVQGLVLRIGEEGRDFSLRGREAILRAFVARKQSAMCHVSPLLPSLSAYPSIHGIKVFI